MQDTKIPTPQITLRWMLNVLLGIKKNNMPKTIRVGFSNTKKTIKTALRASLRLLIDSLPIKLVIQAMKKKLIAMIIASPETEVAKKSAIGFNASIAAPILEYGNRLIAKKRINT